MRIPSIIEKGNPGRAVTRTGVAKEYLSNGQCIEFFDFTQA
jgi:hypothetical protein